MITNKVVTTTYGGSTSGHQKDHPLCDHDNCSVIMRLSPTDGEVEWARTVKGSPRWGVYDQAGGLELGKEDVDGPYIYVAMDDTGEGAVEEATLNAGTSYGGCLSAAGVFTPEYLIFMKKVVEAEDCDIYDTSTFISRQAVEAAPASSVTNGVSCGKQSTGDACLMKFHKHSGLPMWVVDVPPVAGIVPSPDGLSVHIAGWYYPSRAPTLLDSVSLPGYLRDGGLGSQTSGVFNAKLSAKTGACDYVMHSGGGSKDRLYNLVGDAEGNLYNTGYHMNLDMQSLCQMCSPGDDALEWSVKDGYQVVDGTSPPNDCAEVTNTPAPTPTPNTPTRPTTPTRLTGPTMPTIDHSKASDAKGLNGGAIAGIVVGSVAGIAIVGLIARNAMGNGKERIHRPEGPFNDNDVA